MIDHQLHIEPGDDISAEHATAERRHIDRRACLTAALCEVQQCQAFLNGLRAVDPVAVKMHLQLREA